MTTYILIGNVDWESSTIVGVFSSKKKALAEPLGYRYGDMPYDSYHIEAWDLSTNTNTKTYYQDREGNWKLDTNP